MGGPPLVLVAVGVGVAVVLIAVVLLIKRRWLETDCLCILTS
jgi:hypothetical protein